MEKRDTRCQMLRCIFVLALVHTTVFAASQTPSPASPGVGSSNPSATSTPPPAAPVLPPDPFGRETPHGSVLGFLRAAGSQDYARAAAYLDGKRSEHASEELAQKLKYLLDLGTSTDIGAISRSPQGNVEDRLRVSREKVGTIRIPTGDLDILLDRIERPNQTPIWLFSQETLKRVPAAYASVQHRDLAHYFPAWMSRFRLLAVPLWRWALILVSLAIMLLLARVLTRALIWALKTVFHKRMTPGIQASITALRGPVFGLMLAATIRVGAGYALTALSRNYWEAAGTTIALASGAWLLMRLSDIFASFTCHHLASQMQVERMTLVGLLSRLFKILVGIILAILLLRNAGVNVSALVAGLGIGGIALALAAQKTLADLFGGISVVMRGAVRVGDYCTVAGKSGTVEEIGMSALRLRTLDRSVVSIPNSRVAEAELENFSMRDEFWIHQIFTLRFDTPHTVTQTVLKEILAVLRSRKDIEPASARARLIQLTTSGPQIEVFAYFRRPGSDYPQFLAEQEKVILEMMRVVEEAGTSMAAPIGVIRLNEEHSKGLQEQRTMERIPVDTADHGL